MMNASRKRNRAPILNFWFDFVYTTNLASDSGMNAKYKQAQTFKMLSAIIYPHRKYGGGGTSRLQQLKTIFDDSTARNGRRLHVINHLSNTNSVPFTTFTATIVIFHLFAKFELQLFNTARTSVWVCECWFFFALPLEFLYFEHTILWNFTVLWAQKHHEMIAIINEATVCVCMYGWIVREFSEHRLNNKNTTHMIENKNSQNWKRTNEIFCMPWIVYVTVSMKKRNAYIHKHMHVYTSLSNIQHFHM